MCFRKLCRAMRHVAIGAVVAACTLMSASALESGKTMASQLNIRTEPFGPVITTVPEGTTLAILANDGEWAQVSVDGIIGFASMDYIMEDVGEAALQDFSFGGGVISADDVNFRAEPSKIGRASCRERV